MQETKTHQPMEEPPRELLGSVEENTLKGRYLTFRLADEDYGLEIRYVTEIVGIQKITAVPDLPQAIKGVVNLRGKVIPVMDVRSCFCLPEREYDERTCIIVVNVAGKLVGLVVDKVNEVLDIPEDQIELPPNSRENDSGYVQGLGKIDEEVKILLDVHRLIFEEGAKELSEI